MLSSTRCGIVALEAEDACVALKQTVCYQQTLHMALGCNLCRKVRQWHVQVGMAELAGPVVGRLRTSSGSGPACHNRGWVDVTADHRGPRNGTMQTAIVEG